MRRIGLVGFCLSLLTFAGTAGAQPQPRPGTAGDKSNSQFDLRRNETSSQDAETARGRARAGDCAGALASFDAAVARSNDPTIRRDRGLCHEKLGNIYPALEDLRAYVAAQPDAPDAAAIQQKVNELETKTTNEKELLESNNRGSTTASTEDSVDVYGHEDKIARRRERPIGPKPGEPVYLFEYYQTQEALRDRSERSSLREGTGAVIGAWLTIPRFYFLGKALNGWGVAGGGSLRYSGGRTWTGVFDFGWTSTTSFADKNISGIGTQKSTRAGPILMLGAEARLPQTKWAGDQYLLRFGAGYERQVDTDTKAYVNMVVGRFAIGFRHVFSEAFGYEFLFDGGPALAVTENKDTKIGGVVGFTLGLDFGL